MKIDRRTFLQVGCTTGVLALVAGDRRLWAEEAVSALERDFQSPPAEAGISVVWHWTGGLVTKEGITADLEGMAASGINTVNWFYFGGTGEVDGVKVQPTLSAEWWELVDHTLKEAERVGIQMAPHVCSTWGPAGSPAITPELSQQMFAWTEVEVDGGAPFAGSLPKPQRAAQGGRGFGGRGPVFPDSYADYYRDLAVMAFPMPKDWGQTSASRKAKITSNLPIADLAKAGDPNNTERVVNTDKPGWIEFEFAEPFTIRSVTVHPGTPAGTGQGGGFAQAGPNPYRTAHSLEVQASNDRETFRKIGQLEPMYNSWQTTVSKLTHTVTETTARYFRFVYVPGPPVGYDEGMRAGSRQGSADLAHEIDPLGFASIVLSSTPEVHHLPGKNASTWGRSRLVTDAEIPSSACISLGSIVDLTGRLNPDGSINGWTPSPGRWKVMRFGYLSKLTGTGDGLQCDKFNAEAAQVVFHSWFAQFQKRIPNAVRFVKILNIDSWEAQSQNWSPVLRDEFKKRRGYDPIQFLPCMAGVMIESADKTEAFLLDARRTMSECIAENFFGTMYRLAHENGAIVQAECIAPTMMGDGIEFYKNTDWAGGEFWVRATQNWKPNDIGDGTAGARIYGKKIVFAEAYTGGAWQDHPFDLKAMGDHNFVEGVNRMMLHLWAEQYHPHRLPGIPGPGTPFNMLNTWWGPGQAWREYLKKAQVLLQQGQPVGDALYFTGENIPCRSLLSTRLGSCFAAQPALPDGYRHDTVNRDGLLRIVSVEDGRLIMNGIKYSLLVLRPDESFLSARAAGKIKELVAAGAVVVGPKPTHSSSLEQGESEQTIVREIAEQVWGKIDGKTVTENRYGKGRVFWGKPMAEVLALISAEPDVQFAKLVETSSGKSVVVNANSVTGTNPVLTGAARKGWGVEYLHRTEGDLDLYFISNQEYFRVSTEVSFRIVDRVPEFWHADSGRIEEAPIWWQESGRTIIPIEFDPSGSVFVLFRKNARGSDPVVAVSGGASPRLEKAGDDLEVWSSSSGQWTLKRKSGKTQHVKVETVPSAMSLDGAWNIHFPLYGSPKTIDASLASWTENSDDSIKYFSGTALYRKEFDVPANALASGSRLFLDLGEVHDLARCRVNGKDLGVLWKAPYKGDITKMAKPGRNVLEVEVTNTWVNRIAGDAGKPVEQRITFIEPRNPNFPSSEGTVKDNQLLPAGLVGPVQILVEVKATRTT